MTSVESKLPLLFDNQTINATATSLQEALAFRVVKLSLYLVIFVISVAGNSLVCLVVCRRRMRNVTNYFILNLAVADLAVTCVCIPFDIPVQERNYVWPYGAVMCKILYPLQTVSLFASIFTLMAVSLTRHRAIVYPLLPQVTTRIASYTIAGIWMVSTLLVTPYVLVLNYDGAMYCDEVWPGPQYRQAYTASLFMVQYLIPLTIITVAYIQISWELRKNVCSANKDLQAAQLEDTSKVVRMLIIVTLTFAICVLPNNIMWFWLDFGQGDQHFERFWDTVAISQIVLFANSAANPICYTLCNENFRREFKSFFHTCWEHRRYQSVPIISKNQIRRTSSVINASKNYIHMVKLHFSR